MQILFTMCVYFPALYSSTELSGSTYDSSQSKNRKTEAPEVSSQSQNLVALILFDFSFFFFLLFI